MTRGHRWGFVLVLAAGLLLTGCFEVKVESTFEENGSARHVYQATMELSALDELGEFGDDLDPTSDFDTSEEEARELGYDVERIETDTHVGIRLAKTVEDNSNLGQVLNDLFTAGGDDPVSAFSGSYTIDGNVHRLNIVVDGDDLFSDGLDEDEGFSAGMLSSFITLTYAARLPGDLRADETNGRVMPDGSVQWDIPLSGTSTFIAVSQTDGGTSNRILFAALGLLLCLFVGGAVALVLFLFLRSRKKQTVAPAAPAAYQPGPDAPTAQLPQTPQAQNKPEDLNF